MSVFTITEDQYIEYQENYVGYCTHCNDATAEEVEPDAEEYDCPKCGQTTVMGMENALLSGHIEFTKPDKPE